MNVWLMNLKDNRDEKPNLVKSKFTFCKEKGIVGIGWVGYDSNTSNDTAFLKANAAISAFKCDDLVWVHNTDTKEYYICQITGQAARSDDKEYNEYDIGTYCPCKYYFVGAEIELPEGITGKDLISRPTISGASENVSKISVLYFATISQSPLQTNVNNNSVSASFYGANKKKKFCKKKAIIICASIVAAIAVVFLGIIVSKAIIKNTHPVLPNSWNFGDTPENMQIGKELNEDTISKTYHTIDETSAEEINKFFRFKKTVVPNNGVEDLKCYIDFNFNTEKKLYAMTISLPINYDGAIDVIKYYEKALNTKAIIENNTNEYVASLSNNGTDVKIDYDNSMELISVTIMSQKFFPKRFDASKYDLINAYSSCKFEIGGGMFSMSLKELLNLCAPDSKATFTSYLNARKSTEQQMLSLRKKGLFDSLEKSDIVDYLSSSYIIYVHGDICSNPKMPYYRSNDIDIVSVLILFDENGNYKGYKILDYCDDLQTYATIKMAASSYY